MSFVLAQSYVYVYACAYVNAYVAHFAVPFCLTLLSRSLCLCLHLVKTRLMLPRRINPLNEIIYYTFFSSIPCAVSDFVLGPNHVALLFEVEQIYSIIMHGILRSDNRALYNYFYLLLHEGWNSLSTEVFSVTRTSRHSKQRTCCSVSSTT